jgi:transposase
MISAQCRIAISTPLVFEGTTDSKLFNHWLETCLVPQLKAGQLVVMYNYSIHKSNKTKEIIEKVGCKILFLPPYFPDFNPIENYCTTLKAPVKKIKNQ